MTSTATLTATDQFVARHLPTWLGQASAGQVRKLRDCYTDCRASQQRLHAAMAALPAPQAFAEQSFQVIRPPGVPFGTALADLQWLEARYRYEVQASTGFPVPQETRLVFPALARLMQNMAGGEPFYVGSGLVREGEQTILSGDPNRFAKAWRGLDVGKQYQARLDRHFTAALKRLLAEHKRHGFALALELAALKGQIGGQEHAALRQLIEGNKDHGEHGVRAYAGQLRMLDCTVAGALQIQLRGPLGQDLGVMAYLPADAERPLRRFGSLALMNQGLVADLAHAAVHRRIGQLIRLQDRSAFLARLDKRLKDDEPDLALDGQVAEDDPFSQLAVAHVQRLKDDARLLLVSTDDHDKDEARARQARWKSLGLGVLNIAGLFVPGIGELLLADLAVHILAQTYEGVADWAHGHRHEAMEHLLGVAETVAQTAVTGVAGGLLVGGITRSVFVDTLEPVAIDDTDARLWSTELTPYETSRGQAVLAEDGLYAEGERRLVRLDDRYYAVHRTQEHGPWRLRHSNRSQAFGPELVSNGERGWRLCMERPLEWDDPHAMLDRLWPQDPPLSAQQTGRILQVAGVDTEELRGIWVENRPVPFNLRDTLRRFAADHRLERLFARLAVPGSQIDDFQVLAWCRAHPQLKGLGDAQIAQRLYQSRGEWRGQLLEHLAAVQPRQDSLSAILRRDFPGLPESYVQEALRETDAGERRLAEAENRLPLALGTRARALLQLARVNRALEGVFLESSYCDGSGELVFALLRRLPGWSRRINLELRAGSADGRLLAVLDPQGPQAQRTVLVHQEAGFRLHDSRGLAREEGVPEPGGIFEALLVLLDTPARERLGLGPDSAARQLRALLVEQLPTSRREVFNLLGWRVEIPWLNPGKRLPDGRVGYTLGGRVSRGTGAVDMLRQRTRALYPSFDDAAVESFVMRLLRERGSPFDNLLVHERNYAQLDRALTRWVSTGGDDLMRNMQLQFANRLRGAWRYEGEVAVDADGRSQGMSLNLSGWRIGQLPKLPARTDFSHVTELVLAGMELEEVPANFLRCFEAVRTLSINHNRLTAVPPGIVQLRELRVLRLMSNHIRVDETDLEVLASLAQLQTLDLSRNPVRTLDLSGNRLPNLQVLRLSRCGLLAVPEGLESCASLSIADLSDNRIAQVPQRVLSMPWYFRMRLNLVRNAVPAAEIEQLYTFDIHPRVEPVAMTVDWTRNPWLVGSDAQQQELRGQQWARLFAHDRHEGLLRLLGDLTETSDYTQARGYLTGQVWDMIQALDQDGALREAVFSRASEQRGCHDSIAERFSRLQVQVLVQVAEQADDSHSAGERLLDLGRRLFRLERLDAFAQDDARERLLVDPGVDVLEVVLGYRVQLAGPLRLPCQPRSMRFGRLAGLTAYHLAKALAAVRAEEATDALAQSLVERDFWRAWLRRAHPAAFTAVGEPFDTQGTLLDAQGDALASQEYQRRWDVLRHAREIAEEEMCLRLTREAVAATPDVATDASSAQVV